MQYVTKTPSKIVHRVHRKIEHILSPLVVAEMTELAQLNRAALHGHDRSLAQILRHSELKRKYAA